MTRASESHAATVGLRPEWLENAPADLKPVLEIGFEKYGDDPGAIADWIGKLHDYKRFWNLVEASRTPSRSATPATRACRRRLPRRGPIPSVECHDRPVALRES